MCSGLGGRGNQGVDCVKGVGGAHDPCDGCMGQIWGKDKFIG